LSSPETLTCASCGSDEPAGSAFCGNCGAPFAAPEAEPTVTSTAAPTPGVQTCASCGNEEPEGAEFCGNCGAALVAESWPEAKPEPEPEPVAPTQPARWRSRPALAAAGGLLLVGVALAVLFGVGAFDGGSGRPESVFLQQVNSGALAPLRAAVESAADDVDTAPGGFDAVAGADGTRIVEVANRGAQHLRALHGLTAREQDDVRLLVAFLTANIQYGQAFGAYRPEDAQRRLALDDAIRAIRSTRERVEAAVPTGLELAAPGTYLSSRDRPVPPRPHGDVGPATPASYVDQVDRLLTRSHAVVVSLGAFVPKAARDEITRGQAVAAARSYLSQRQRELLQAASLDVPPDFAQAQGLLIRSLQASVVDDQALLAWAIARRDGGDAQAAFKEANRLGKQATRFKRRFLSLYGSLRQQATGRAPSSLPAFF
jgi:hypothetical protein